MLIGSTKQSILLLGYCSQMLLCMITSLISSTITHQKYPRKSPGNPSNPNLFGKLYVDPPSAMLRCLTSQRFQRLKALVRRSSRLKVPWVNPWCSNQPLLQRHVHGRRKKRDGDGDRKDGDVFIFCDFHCSSSRWRGVSVCDFYVWFFLFLLKMDF